MLSQNKRWLVLMAALTLSACAGSKQVIRQSGLEAIAHLRELPSDTRPRVVVAPLRNHTQKSEELNVEQNIDNDWLAGVRDLVVTAMVNSGGFTVLEREAIPGLAEEQAFSAAPGEVVMESALEGADIVLLPAVTDFSPAAGGALPLPIPVSSDGDFIIVWLRAGTASINMDVRLVDVASGRVLRSVAVEGKAREFRVDLDAFLWLGRDIIALPGVLGIYNNTAVHAAMLQMVNLAVAELARSSVASIDDITDLKTKALFEGAEE